VKRLVNLFTAPGMAWTTTCAGIFGDDATKPAPAGSTNEPAWPADDQITISGCRTSVWAYIRSILLIGMMG
jgi:hypothetical protein